MELHCHSYFSLLDGASSPEALVEQAVALGMPALALTDDDGLYGAVRFWTAARAHGLQPILGSEVTLEDGGRLVLLAETQAGYANLCRLLSSAHRGGANQFPADPWPGKTAPRLAWATLNAHRDGLIALSGGGPVGASATGDAGALIRRLLDIFGPQHLYVELQRHHLPGESHRVRDLVDLAGHFRLPLVATNDVHYARRAERRLHDVLVSIRHLCSRDEARARGLLRVNSEYFLKPPAEMARLFAGLPEALRNSLAIAERCHVSLDFSRQRLPAFPVPPGHTPFSFLYDLCQQGLHRKLAPVTPQASRQLARELDVIETTGLAGYFLIVWDIVRFAQARGIRYQGRGSAANSLVAYLLDMTPVDPLAHHLLFDRFLSEDSRTMPDIDIDFAADRREEVIDYVYGRYGVEHTAMVCNVVTFRKRSALRDVGRALGLAPDLVERLARERAEREADTESDTTPHRLLWEMCRELEGVPRHLSIHSGGMLITAAPLVEVVPTERATMAGRVVVQWDKDSVEDAGLIKLDLLGLRMLGLVDEAVRLIEAGTG
ncbi:MAG: DNA polymerase III subunit alpha, partial [Anaerolineae bacterium]|nr:DNA polymerase III subunit alpha [Anaerolineae bacterium]